MTCNKGCCSTYDKEFDSKVAQKDLKRFNSKGASSSTLSLIKAIKKWRTSKDERLLDIGSGIGAIPMGLAEERFKQLTSVDASGPYQEVLRAELSNKFKGQPTYVLGDFVEVADKIENADVVTLDKVICCYEDFQMLISKSVAKCHHLFGIVIPRNVWWVKVIDKVGIFFRKVFGSGFVTYNHSFEEINQLITEHGFKPVFNEYRREWHISMYERIV